ncbi:MAG TPA: hypothetical protein V6C65_22340 [Allocoleopsis sp.]
MGTRGFAHPTVTFGSFVVQELPLEGGKMGGQLWTTAAVCRMGWGLG